MTLAYREVFEYELGVQRIFVHDWAEGTDLYKRAGTASTPETLAEHDGPVLLDDDKFRRVEKGEYASFQAHHPHGGRMESWEADSELQTEAVLLKKIPRANKD